MSKTLIEVRLSELTGELFVYSRDDSGELNLDCVLAWNDFRRDVKVDGALQRALMAMGEDYFEPVENDEETDILLGLRERES